MKTYRKWFAWHPVMTADGWVWLRSVDRRWSSGAEDGLPIEYSAWEYR